MHLSVPLIKWGRQEAVMAEQEPAPQSEDKERNAQPVKAGTGGKDRVQGYGSGVSGGDKKS